MKKIIGDSRTFIFIKKIVKIYLNSKGKLSVSYRDSQIYKSYVWIRQALLICLNSSFLGKISVVRPEGNPEIINDSGFVKHIVLSYKKIAICVTGYLAASKVYILNREVRKFFHTLTLNALSVIFITAILIDSLLSVLLGKEIGFWGWLMRGMFIFIGFVGLFCQASWEEIQSSSFVKRCINANEKR